MGFVNQDSFIASPRTPALVFFQGLFYMAWSDPKSNLQLTTYGEEGPMTAPVGQQSSTAPSAATDGTLIYIAWTGINSKKVYVSTTSNGTTFQRTSFDYTSDQSTSVAFFNQVIYIAYTGTDSQSTVNLLSYPNGKPVPIGKGATSGPSLAVYNGKLWIAWAAGDEFIFYSSLDGQHFTQQPSMSNMSTVSPSLAAAGVSLFVVWNNDGDVTIQAYQGTKPVTIDASSSSVAAAVTAFSDTLYIAWPQTTDGNVIEMFTIAESDITQASARREPGPMDSDYITASSESWGIAITLSAQATSDVVNGANVAAGITAALAGAAIFPPLATAILGIVSGTLWAGSSVLSLMNRGDGVTLMVPWSSFIPVQPPLGPGGIVIPVPAGVVNEMAHRR